MPLAPDKLNQLHDSIHAEIRALTSPGTAAEASPPPAHVQGMAIPAGLLNIGISAIAGQVVPILTDLALRKVGPAVESFAESHAAWVRQYVSTSALEFAAKILKELETAQPPGPA